MFLSKDFRFKHKVLLMHNMLRQSYTRIFVLVQFIYQHGYLMYKKIIWSIKYLTPYAVSSLGSLVKNKTWFVAETV